MEVRNKPILITLVILLSFCWLPGIQSVEDYQPQQIHIAIGDVNEDMVISWVTYDPTPSSVVEYGLLDLNYTASGSQKNFTNIGPEMRVMFLHKTVLKGLRPDTRYYYHCGSELGWSDLFTFKTWKVGSDWPIRVAMYGDLGSQNAQSLPRLQTEVQRGLYDAVIHVGDFAYDMQDDNGRVGDEFMRQIQPIAAYVPYMTVPGNHEYDINFRNYKARFTMPRYLEMESMFYSFNMGPVHFIGVNTEYYYYLFFDIRGVYKQYSWLVRDLEEATRPEVRANRPWIILFGHRPMYCSNSYKDDCQNVDCLLRVGLPFIKQLGMEKLLYKYGVDLAVWAHEHSYERLWPIYDYNVMNGSMEQPYRNPPAPVHITTGSAGCDENHDGFTEEQPSWSAYRTTDYGYTKLTVYNTTHLYWEQISDDQNGKVVDSVWLVRDRHGSFADLPDDS